MIRIIKIEDIDGKEIKKENIKKGMIVIITKSNGIKEVHQASKDFDSSRKDWWYILRKKIILGKSMPECMRRAPDSCNTGLLSQPIYHYLDRPGSKRVTVIGKQDLVYIIHLRLWSEIPDIMPESVSDTTAERHQPFLITFSTYQKTVLPEIYVINFEPNKFG